MRKKFQKIFKGSQKFLREMQAQERLDVENKLRREEGRPSIEEELGLEQDEM